MQSNDHGPDEVSEGRRELLKALAATSGAVATRILLPAAWSTPIVAAMALPAHAQTSSPISLTIEPDAKSALAPSSSPAFVAMTGVNTIKLYIYQPASLHATRIQFHVYERLRDDKAEPPAPFVRVVMSATTSGDPKLSSTYYQINLSRSRGTYEYQQRWLGGHTAWTEVIVNGLIL